MYIISSIHNIHFKNIIQVLIIVKYYYFIHHYKYYIIHTLHVDLQMQTITESAIKSYTLIFKLMS